MEREREKGSPSTSQDKTSKFQGDFSCPQVLHPLPSSRKQQSGCASDRDLGQEHHSPSPAPAEMAASWDEGWGQQLPEEAVLGCAGGPGRGQGTATGSCCGRLAAPWWVQRPEGQSREGSGGDIVAFVPPTHSSEGRSRTPPWAAGPQEPRTLTRCSRSPGTAGMAPPPASRVGVGGTFLPAAAPPAAPPPHLGNRLPSLPGLCSVQTLGSARSKWRRFPP